MLSSAPERKERGAFFTPAPIAEFLAEWAIHDRQNAVLEPSCGEAEFLVAAASVKRRLGARADESNLIGVEIHERSAENARKRLAASGTAATIVTADFFDFTADRKFDAVLGNPPFIRYQTYGGDGRAKSLAAALGQGVRLNRLASAWAAFVVHACSFLAPDGRLALVLPAELLSVNYAASVRSFLMRRFSSLKIVAFEEKVFPEVQEEVVLLMASGSGTTDRFELLQARNTSRLSGLLGRPWTYFSPHKTEKWTNAFIPGDALALYRECTAKKRFERLCDWGRTYLGAVTGANDYFIVSREQADALQLPAKDLVEICPPGSAHLKGLEFTGDAWRHMRNEGRKVYLFAPATSPLSSGAARYVLRGEQLNLHSRYKCRVRRPWWRVPLVEAPDLFLTYMNHDGFRLVSNNAQLHITNSHYGLRLHQNRRKIGKRLLPICALNSLTLLGAEIEGRSFGGGLLKLEPRDADNIPVPSLSSLADAADALIGIVPQLAVPLRQSKLDDVVQVVDNIVLRELLGLNSTEIRTIRNVRRALFERRQSRTKAS